MADIKNMFKRKSRTVKFDRDEKSDYEKRFERVPVKPTQVVAPSELAAQYAGKSEDELVVLLDRAKGKQKEVIREALRRMREEKPAGK